MSKSDQVIIVGIGEVGGPLYTILSKSYSCVKVDIQPVDAPGPCSVLHICYPFQIPDFIGVSARYIEKYRPALTIINSTVSPGTTAKVAEAAQAPVAYSPVRGKHAKMVEDMQFYRKFVGADTPHALDRALAHFEGAGLKTGVFPNSRVGELAKLLETTWLGILVGWAQEVERIAAGYGATYKDVYAFIEEIAFLPGGIFPGVIGGHCVMPNIAILRSILKSDFLDAVVNSNEMKRSAANAQHAEVEAHD